MFNVLIVDDDDTYLQSVEGYLGREREGDEPLFNVRGATTPETALATISDPSFAFDVFLIDVRLRADIDGIELMQQLQSLQPDSDAIILTGYDDDETGRRAFELGAYRYLRKPQEPREIRELTFILRRLKQQRSIQRERDWLKVLTDVAEESQRAASKQAVADIVVQGGQRLGFQRARLWWALETERDLQLAAHVGSPELDQFSPIRLPIKDSHYAQKILEGKEAIFFDDSTLGPTDLERICGAGNFKTPVGEWAGIALRSEDRLLAVLLLDNGDRPQRYSSEQRKLISLFGQQAAVAIEKAHFFELEQQKSKELGILNQIGQQITSRAADDLDGLLSDLRQKIGDFLDVSNFMVVLKDEDIQRLDFRLHLEEGQPRDRRWVELSHGLVGHVIAIGKTVFEPKGTSDYLKRNGLRRQGRPAKCWLGVPLRVANRAIGVVAVQNYETPHAFTEDQARFLEAVGDAVAGAIQAARAKEKEADMAQRLAILQRFGSEFMNIAEQSEDRFWHAVLTAATADYGLRFNRAMLFLLEKGSQSLRGVMGIGERDKKAARKSWKRDKTRGFTYEQYLKENQAGSLRRTPVEEVVKAMTLDIAYKGSILQQILQSGRRAIVPSAEAATALPPVFIQAFGVADYALVPLRAGDRTLGVAIVDNIHNRYPLAPAAVEQLETMFIQAALVFQNIRQRHMRDVIVNTNYQVVSKAAKTSLGETLQLLCEAAAQVTEADSVVIYPLLEDGSYDQSSIAAVGLKGEKPVKPRPRRYGVTAYVLSRITWLVPDVVQSRLTFSRRPLRLHAFIQREGIQAFIGVSVKDIITDQAVGALYLNYRQSRPFDERDRSIADMFAGLIATAIRTYRDTESTRNDLADAKQRGEASRQELEILQRVLRESLTPDATEEKLIPVVLRAAHSLLDQPDVQIALLLRAWMPPQQHDGEPRECQNQHHLDKAGNVISRQETEIFRGISGRVLQTGNSERIGDITQDELGKPYYSFDRTQGAASELDVPIKSGQRVIGVLNAESTTRDAFGETEEAEFTRLASVTALAFDNVRRQTHLHDLLDAAKHMTAPTELDRTFDAIVDAARDIAPDVSAITVWYKNPEDDQILLGSFYGVRDITAVKHRRPEPDSVVAQIMNRKEPLWAINAQSEASLGARFVRAEGIQSTAAFPLRADDQPVGAMFFNYRTQHTFSNEERVVFSLLAELAALSVQDATLLHAAKQERERLRHSLDVTNAVGASLTLDEVLTRVMGKLTEIFPSTAPCVLLYREADQALEFASPSLNFYKIDNPRFSTAVPLRLDGPGLSVQTALKSIAQGEAAVDVYPTVKDLPNYLSLITSTKSQMNVGLMGGNKQPLGVLVLESDLEGAFPDDTQNLVKGIAQQISIAIERARQGAQLRFKTLVASRTSLAAELAHEAGKEIALIRNRTYWLTEEEPTIEKNRLYANEIDESAKRLLQAIHSDTETELDTRPLPTVEGWIQRWLKEIVTDKLPDIRVHFESSASKECEVRARQTVLRYVIRFVLRNSIEAMERRGDISCSVSLADAHTLELQFTDTGPGIPDAVRQLLLSEPVSTKGDNRGYGLLFARSTLEDMGGGIRIPKTPSGAKVVLKLSIVERQAEVQYG